MTLNATVFEAPAVQTLLDLTVAEDLGDEGDVTSRVVPASARCQARLVLRQAGVVAGLAGVPHVLARLAPDSEFVPCVQDGQHLQQGTLLAHLRGNAREVLAAERLLLNLLQRLSGIATATQQFVAAIGGTQAKLLDTRKTCPGWRALEKYAVRTGGGVNHRMGLYDQVLIKDNHLGVWGGEEAIPQVVAQARQTAPPGTPVEVEVTTLDGGLKAAQAGADIVLLDNFSPSDLALAVTRIRRDCALRGQPAPLLEASGGINLESVAAVAQTGVDRISTGWITHSAPSLDIALDFVELQ